MTKDLADTAVWVYAARGVCMLDFLRSLKDEDGNLIRPLEVDDVRRRAIITCEKVQ